MMIQRTAALWFYFVAMLRKPSSLAETRYPRKTFGSPRYSAQNRWQSWLMRRQRYFTGSWRKTQILATKIALLQSKRLYPDEIENAVDMHPTDYEVGFGRLLTSESEYRSSIKPRTFHISPDSKYRALGYKDEQYEAILKYSGTVPVHYLLYSPLNLPHSVEIPVCTQLSTNSENIVGCRVIKAEILNSKLVPKQLAKAAHRTYEQVAVNPVQPDFWKLHNFIADLVLGCKEGYLAGTNPFSDETLYRLFALRGGPISVAYRSR
jgi:hypothetical protein